MDPSILTILKGSSVLVVLFIWYQDHKSSITREKDHIEQLNKIIDLQLTREKENFSLLKDMIASNLLQNEKLEQIKSMVLNNQWCPVHRKYLVEGAFRDEPDDNAA